MEAKPVDTSGKAVAAAKMVAPNKTPVIPMCLAIASPLTSNPTPATNVSREHPAQIKKDYQAIPCCCK